MVISFVTGIGKRHDNRKKACGARHESDMCCPGKYGKIRLWKSRAISEQVNAAEEE